MRTPKPRKKRVNHSSQIEAQNPINGKEIFGQLVKELNSDDPTRDHYAASLRNPDPDRSLLLTAHIIVERLIESTLETRLPHPHFWMPTADFNSKVRLARALGLIHEEQHRACSVLNSARNALAHKLDPLPQKWRDELERLSWAVKVDPTKDEGSFQAILRKVVAIVLGRREKMMFNHRRLKMREEHRQRWHELMEQKVHEVLMSGNAFDQELMNLQVDLQLAREVNQRKNR